MGLILTKKFRIFFIPEIFDKFFFKIEGKKEGRKIKMNPNSINYY